ncbi:MAG: ATP-binding cassette domain-containing protein [Bdellovibrionales bacterium]|nr:ATP-binding cassette domain-containing protein [Bdellovibrionales bacterium]
MVELQNVSLTFESQAVLESVNLTIEDHSAISILGPSGIGKSSLLKLIAGIIQPSAGKIYIDKKSPQKWLSQPKDIPISMLFQKNALFDSMSVFENVAFPLREKDLYANEEIASVVQQTLEDVGLWHVKDLYPDEISGGMQKRLGIARSLVLTPKHILYDDPTAGLDPITSRGIAQLIRETQKKHKMTIVSVTNDMVRAKQLGDRFVFVYDRQISVFNSSDDLEKSKDPVVYQFIRGLEEGPLRVQND